MVTDCNDHEFPVSSAALFSARSNDIIFSSTSATRPPTHQFPKEFLCSERFVTMQSEFRNSTAWIDASVCFLEADLVSFRESGQDIQTAAVKSPMLMVDHVEQSFEE